MSELTGPDYGGADYDAETRALGQLGVRCGCGCGQDRYDGQRTSAHLAIARATEFAAVFPDWDDE